MNDWRPQTFYCIRGNKLHTGYMIIKTNQNKKLKKSIFYTFGLFCCIIAMKLTHRNKPDSATGSKVNKKSASRVEYDVKQKRHTQEQWTSRPLFLKCQACLGLSVTSACYWGMSKKRVMFSEWELRRFNTTLPPRCKPPQSYCKTPLFSSVCGLETPNFSFRTSGNEIMQQALGICHSWSEHLTEHNPAQIFWTCNMTCSAKHSCGLKLP